MGRGIAQVCATAGFPTLVYDTAAGAASRAIEGIASSLRDLVQKQRIDEAAATRAVSMLKACNSIEELAPAAFVIEAIVENLAIKQALFAQLESVVGASAILASNTSSLSITGIAAQCRNPERVAGFHFFNPPPLMKLVEVIPGLRTGDSTIESLMELAKEIGKTAITAKDSPGFVVNHAGRALMPEALRIAAEGIATPADIDLLVRECGGFRMGPFELLDLVGADVAHVVMEGIYKQYYEEPRYQPSAMLATRVAGGLFGRKSRQGFYSYPAAAEAQGEKGAAPANGAGTTRPGSFWIAEPDEEMSQRLARFLKGKGARVDAEPGDDAIVCVAPLGEDCSHACARLGLDPARVVAFDMIIESPKRITVMATPLTTRDTLEQVRVALDAAQIPFTVIQDSPGFVLQRLMAMVINVGTRIAELGIAAPEEVDLGVRLGLNYPEGPFALGDRLGPRRVLRVLDSMSTTLRDPKYAATAWLRRRAVLGCSLSVTAH
jgi:3-hydroxybutyryl-CoA dehydrogenase